MALLAALEEDVDAVEREASSVKRNVVLRSAANETMKRRADVTHQRVSSTSTSTRCG